VSTQTSETDTVNISAKLVKELRDQTGAGFMDCKAALQETNGDLEKAVDWLRKKGMAKAQRRAGRATSEGRVTSYIHAGDKIGVMVEINCESDFVARTDNFKDLCHDIALHIAAAEPRYVAREDVTPEILDREREVYLGQARESGKPEKVIEKIVDGKMEKFYEEACLLEQHFIKDDKVTVKELVDGVIAKIGENVKVRRFVRFKLGESTLAAETVQTEEDGKDKEE
jgi:elongation factor Ts